MGDKTTGDWTKRLKPQVYQNLEPSQIQGRDFPYKEFRLEDFEIRRTLRGGVGGL